MAVRLGKISSVETQIKNILILKKFYFQKRWTIDIFFSILLSSNEIDENKRNSNYGSNILNIRNS